MRVVQIDKRRPHSPLSTGGVERYIRTLTDSLTPRGWSFTSFGCSDEADMPDWHDYRRTRCPLAVGRMIHNRQAARRLDAWLERNPADLAHLHNSYHHLTPSILAVLRRRRIPVVMTVHDYRLLCPTKHFYRPDGLCMRCQPGRFVHAASPRCAGLGGAALAVESTVQHGLGRYRRGVDHFIAPTDWLRDRLIEAGYDPHRISVVPNPVVALPDPPAGRKPARPMVAFVGRLATEKGPDRLVTLAGSMREVDFHLAGDGPMRDALQQRIDRDGLTNVRLLGPLGESELAGLYASAAVVALPSRCMENAPGAMLEAMSLARPVVVPDQPPLREVVTDGQTGRLFATASDAALAGAIRDLLDAPDMAGQIGRAAADRVNARHAPPAAADRVEAIYRRLLEGRA